MPAQKIKPWRGYPSANVVHAMRVHVNMASPSPSLGQVALTAGTRFHIGTLPAGAFVLPASKHVLVAFNGTTPTVDVGTETVPGAFVPSAAIAPGAVAFAGGLSGPNHGFQASETPVYIVLGGTGITAGEVDVVLPFYISKD